MLIRALPDQQSISMPRLNLIAALPEPERKLIEDEIRARNFADYDGLADWLQQMGFEIGRSSVYRHGAKLKKRLQAVKDSTEAARMIAEAAPDDEDLRSAAVISMVQTELFDVMVSLQEADSAEPGERVGLMESAAKSVLNMTRASVLQKKWKQEISEKIQKAFSKLEAEAGGTKPNGRKLDAETLKAVREEVYGLV